MCLKQQPSLDTGPDLAGLRSLLLLLLPFFLVPQLIIVTGHSQPRILKMPPRLRPLPSPSPSPSSPSPYSIQFVVYATVTNVETTNSSIGTKRSSAKQQKKRRAHRHSSTVGGADQRNRRRHRHNKQIKGSRGHYEPENRTTASRLVAELLEEIRREEEQERMEMNKRKEEEERMKMMNKRMEMNKRKDEDNDEGKKMKMNKRKEEMNMTKWKEDERITNNNKSMITTIWQLYNQCSRAFVRIREDDQKVDANGKAASGPQQDEQCQSLFVPELVMGERAAERGWIRLVHFRTGRLLCLGKRRGLMARKPSARALRDPLCWLREKLNPSGYSSLISSARGRAVGFSRGGRPITRVAPRARRRCFRFAKLVTQRRTNGIPGKCPEALVTSARRTRAGDDAALLEMARQALLAKVEAREPTTEEVKEEDDQEERADQDQEDPGFLALI